MRPVSLGNAPPPGAGINTQIAWIINALQEIERASYEEPTDVANSYSHTGTLTVARDVNVTTPTAANLAAVLASFFADLRKRGVKRT